MAELDTDRPDLDAPAPPGGPQRQDVPAANVTPGPNPAGSVDDAPAEPTGSETPPEPSVEPSSTPEGPSVIPAPPTPEGEPGPDPEKAEQSVNAGTSLDEPSDNSGAE